MQATTLFFLLAGLFFASNAFAQTPCGSIITPGETVAITDCDNPFGNTDSGTISLRIEGQSVSNGDVVIIPEGGTTNYRYPGGGLIEGPSSVFYLHEGEDYRLIDTEPSPLTRPLLRVLADQFFDEDVNEDLYINFLLGDYSSEEDDEWDVGLFIQFADYVEANFTPSVPVLLPGEYTFVLTEIVPVLSYFENDTSENLFKKELGKFLDFIIPTAHAQYIVPDNVYTLNFTLAVAPPEPTGASSVLFLPGIQASRLYKGAGGSEDQLWEPNYNSDVLDLVMSNSGNSAKDIYTKDVVDEVVIPFIGGNIYKGFLKMLEDMEDEEIIVDSTAFAYDWRYDVKNIADNGTKYQGGVKDLVGEIESLAQDSNTGKVTIVGHSNGGLLAKALIAKLVTLNLDNLVDKVIFIGTPHLGTPKAIGTILHGYDQQKLGGFIIGDEDARYVMNNMPGAYGLLPSSAYLSKMNEPLVTFARGSSTQSFTDSYGESVDEMDNYINFLLGVDGRESDYFDISKPLTVNAGILRNAISLHDNELDNWAVPEGIEVFNIVGVGLPTMKTLEYRNLQENRRCSGTAFGTFVCEEIEYFYRPYAHFTKYGDETVTSLSSESVEGNTFYFDFEEYSKDRLLASRKSHADFTEVNTIQSLLKNIINSNSFNEKYIYTDAPSLNTVYEVLAIDSPVRIYKIDSSGNITGLVEVGGEVVLKQDIPNSQYFEFAGTKYLISPATGDSTVILEGEDYGGYSLTIAKLTSEDIQIIEREIINATTTPNMIAIFTNSRGEYSNIDTDLNGDGVVDFIYGWDGNNSEVIKEQGVEEDEITINRSSSGTRVKKLEPIGLVLGVSSPADLNDIQKRLYLLLQKLSTLLIRWQQLQNK